MLPRPKSGLTGDLVMAYAAIVLKHLRLMCLLVALALTAGLTYYTFARPVFHSKSLVHVQRLDRPMDRTVGADQVFIDSNDQTLLKEFGSDYIIERTARRFGVNASRREIMISHIKKITIGYDAQGHILVEVFPFSLDWANNWAEVMVQEYLAYRDEKRLERRELAVASFTRELDQIRSRMEEAFNRKHDFKDASETDRLLIEFQQLNEIPRDLLAINRRLTSMDQARRALDSAESDAITKLSLLSLTEKLEQRRGLQMTVGQMVPQVDGGDSQRIVVPAMINPNALPWEDLEREQRRLSSQMRNLSNTFLPGHPRMRELQLQLDAVNQALEVELDVALQRFDLEYANLKFRQAQLEARLPEVQEISRRHQRYLQEYDRHDAGQLAWGGIHDQMTKQLSALDFWSDKERVDLQFMGKLEARQFPVSPNRMKLALASLLFGLGLAISIPFLLEYLNTSISDPDQAEEDLKISSLGLIPFLNDEALNGKEEEGRESEFLEHFRIIRTNMLLTAGEEKIPQVVLITSSLPEEGKTTVSQNMAKSFARRGERTLLIDADLRRGRQHKTFGISARPGLAEVLGEKADAGSACVTISPNLDLLPCGRHTGHASELIDSDSFAATLCYFRQRYDRIIIDSPPALGLAEAAILQRHADGVMMVVWAEFTPMHAVRDAVRALRGNGAKICGFVLNRVDFDSVYYKYRYFYYSPSYYSKYSLPADAATG